MPDLAIPSIAAAIILAGAVAIALLARRANTTSVLVSAPSAAAPPSPDPSTLAPRALPSAFTRVDASDLYPRVKEQAQAWGRDVLLQSIAAGPVVGDKVDLLASDGAVVYVFAKRDAPLSSGPGRLALTVTRNGIQSSPMPEPAKAEGSAREAPLQIGEPNCVFDAAVKAAHASGIPAELPMRLRYEADAASRRSVWTAKIPGRRDLDRVMDGQSCAVLLRK